MDSNYQELFYNCGRNERFSIFLVILITKNLDISRYRSNKKYNDNFDKLQEFYYQLLP